MSSVTFIPIHSPSSRILPSPNPRPPTSAAMRCGHSLMIYQGRRGAGLPVQYLKRGPVVVPPLSLLPSWRVILAMQSSVPRPRSPVHYCPAALRRHAASIRQTDSAQTRVAGHGVVDWQLRRRPGHCAPRHEEEGALQPSAASPSSLAEPGAYATVSGLFRERSYLLAAMPAQAIAVVGKTRPGHRWLAQVPWERAAHETQRVAAASRDPCGW